MNEMVDADKRDYVPLILRMMAETDTAQRRLASRTGISKSRLGVILHSNPAKRAQMTVIELQNILHALGTNMIQAFIHLETFPYGEPIIDDRYATLIVMLCEFFVSLPKKLIEVLDALDGLDGSEVRKEWAPPLQNVVIKRVATEVIAVTERRARLAQSDEFLL